MYHRCLLIFLVFITSSLAKAQEMSAYATIKNLQDEWKAYAGGQFHSVDPKAKEQPHAVYFTVDVKKNPESFLKVSAAGEFNLFINHQLIKTSSGTMLLSLDSLSQKYSSSLQCGVFQSKGIERLTTEIVKQKAVGAISPLVKREPAYFFNFSIIASLIVFAYFIILMRTLPRLATNYFNVIRLVSLQEREENLAGSRVSSTANILFYLFAGLLAGLVLTVIFHFGDGKTVSSSLWIESPWDGFVEWIKWSALILALLLLKLVMTYLISGLFNVGELVPFYFFNFLRLTFFIFGFSALLSLGYFIIKGHNPAFYSYLLYGIGMVAFFWVIFIYLKLLPKVPFRFFHLFSYLCVSEIIPMVILFKVLLF